VRLSFALLRVNGLLAIPKRGGAGSGNISDFGIDKHLHHVRLSASEEAYRFAELVFPLLSLAAGVRQRRAAARQYRASGSPSPNRAPSAVEGGSQSEPESTAFRECTSLRLPRAGWPDPVDRAAGQSFIVLADCLRKLSGADAGTAAGAAERLCALGGYFRFCCVFCRPPFCTQLFTSGVGRRRFVHWRRHCFAFGPEETPVRSSSTSYRHHAAMWRNIRIFALIPLSSCGFRHR